jgi:aryl-alcohol dehydrogenase-like predicted oxidoreductase
MRYLATDSPKKISKIGLGTSQFGSAAWGYGRDYARKEAPAIVHRALQLGVTLFDTAEIYGFEPWFLVRRALLKGVAFSDTARIRGFGHGERILGTALGALGENRDSAFIATKFYPIAPAAQAVEQRAVASAERLGTRQLDLYQVHYPGGVVRDQPIMRGLRALQNVGVVGEVGVSNCTLDRWQNAERALGGRVLSNQVRYCLADRSAELELLPFAEANGRIIIAYSPLAQGLLSGRYHNGHQPANRMRAATPLFLPENLERSRRLIEVLREVAAAHRVTPAQIALAWVIHRPEVAAIPGAASVRQLEDNVAAAEIGLADDEYEALAVAAGEFQPAGGPMAGLPDRIRARFLTR